MFGGGGGWRVFVLVGQSPVDMDINAAGMYGNLIQLQLLVQVIGESFLLLLLLCPS